MDRVNVQVGKAETGQIMKGLYIILRGLDSISPQESRTVSVRKATPFGVWEWTTGSREVHQRLFCYISGQKMMRVCTNEDMAVRV